MFSSTLISQYNCIGAMQGTTVGGTVGDNGPWSYQLNSPTAILFDSYGFMYILDYGNNRVVKWFPGAAYGVPVVSASFYYPCGMQFDRLNNIVIADTYNHRITSFGVTCRKFLILFKILMFNCQFSIKLKLLLQRPLLHHQVKLLI